MVDVQKELNDLILTVKREGASDLHLAAGRTPVARVSGNLVPLSQKKALTEEEVENLLALMLTKKKFEQFLEDRELDFSYEHEGQVRFRGNAFYQRGFVGVALRMVPNAIKTITELNLPPLLETFAHKQQGFFLVVGPVGQGKSTTLASMVELINQQRAEHIVTIEDPIEYLFKEKRSLVDQREVNLDTRDFPTALRAALRQDVDVIMIGEMRSYETISTAVTAAETGHLVLSTLHTNDAVQTIDRIIDSFPPEGQAQIRAQLAASLIGIFSQRLIPRVSGGLIPAFELLINNNAVASLIREGRTSEVKVIIETGSQQGMIDMNRSLAELVRRGEITQDNAYQYSFDPKGLERLL